MSRYAIVGKTGIEVGGFEGTHARAAAVGQGINLLSAIGAPGATLTVVKKKYGCKDALRATLTLQDGGVLVAVSCEPSEPLPPPAPVEVAGGAAPDADA